MNIDIKDRDEEKLVFTADGLNPAMANVIRRAMISDIPVLAVEEADIYENSSAIYNELLAHRLGLVPLKFDPDALNLREECQCDGEGCVQCEVVLTLEGEGPGMVYTGDLETDNEDVEPLYDNMPLVKLLEGQSVDLEALAILGRGRDHSKWQASITSYRYYPEIEVGDISSEEAEEIAENCPNAFARVGRGVSVNEDQLYAISDACIESLPESVDLTYDDSKFVFTVETTSGLEPETLVSLALNVLESKMERFETEVAEYK